MSFGHWEGQGTPQRHTMQQTSPKRFVSEVVGEYTKAASERGQRRQRADCEGRGVIKVYRAFAEGDCVTCDNSGNMLHTATDAEWLKEGSGAPDCRMRVVLSLPTSCVLHTM